MDRAAEKRVYAISALSFISLWQISRERSGAEQNPLVRDAITNQQSILLVSPAPYRMSPASFSLILQLRRSCHARARMTQIQENTQKAGLFGLANSNKEGVALRCRARAGFSRRSRANSAGLNHTMCGLGPASALMRVKELKEGAEITLIP